MIEPAKLPKAEIEVKRAARVVNILGPDKTARINPRTLPTNRQLLKTGELVPLKFSLECLTCGAVQADVHPHLVQTMLQNPVTQEVRCKTCNTRGGLVSSDLPSERDAFAKGRQAEITSRVDGKAVMCKANWKLVATEGQWSVYDSDRPAED